MAYDIGDQVTFTADFYNTSNQLTDPATLSTKVKDSNGIVTTYTYPTDTEIVKVSTGKYELSIVLTVSGAWWVRWEATAPNIVEETSISVRARKVV